MPKTLSVRGSQNVIAQLESIEGDSLLLRSFFDSLIQAFNCQSAVIMTTLPRGTMQVAQPSRFDEAFLKAYARDAHAFDRPGWEGIVRGEAVRESDCFSGNSFESSAYYTNLLQPSGLRHVAAAPLVGPILDGYAGALQLFRTPSQGPFTAADLDSLSAVAKQLDAAVVRVRDSRRGPLSTKRGGTSGSALGEVPSRLKHRLIERIFAFDQNVRLRVGGDQFDKLDASLKQAMLDLARQRLGHINGKPTASDRSSLPDATGDLWHFRVVTHHTYPALGDGPFVFLSLSPDCIDWAAVRPADFTNDAEISRLIPAIKFMQEQFHRGPTLNEIAKQVHLSPFHFHRRFTELLGITPKHLLLDCQIELAKSLLVARQKELAEIATACGFAHQSHFTSRFKQATGLTPTRWRRLASDAAKN